MTVKVGSTHSNLRQVNGGCPKGLILGVFLFNATIDDLEDGRLQPRGESCLRFAETDGPSLTEITTDVEAPQTRLDFSHEQRQEVPSEPNHRVEAKWRIKLAKLLHFMDDGITLSWINLKITRFQGESVSDTFAYDLDAFLHDSDGN